MTQMDILAGQRTDDEVVCTLGEQHAGNSIRLCDVSDVGAPDVCNNVWVRKSPHCEEAGGEADGDQEVDWEYSVLEGSKLLPG